MENTSVPVSETGPIIPSTSASQLKSKFKELLDETKKDILSQVKDKVDQIYTDFESVAIENEEVASTGEASEPGITDKIENFVQPNIPDQEDPTDTVIFQNLALECFVVETISPALIPGLAGIVNSLFRDRLTKEKLSEVQSQYIRPENCPNLVAPKVSKQIWQENNAGN
jgi:hypothetical protein